MHEFENENEIDGDWLSAEGEYRELVHQLCASDPRLRQRDYQNARQQTQGPETTPRMVMLELQKGATSFSEPLPFRSANALREHLQTRSPDGGRVYILEGLDAEYQAALGERFKMHPSMFAEHERVTVFGNFASKEGDTMVLATTAATREHSTLKYFESFALPSELRNTFWLWCAETGRHIGATRAFGSFSDVGVVRRKATVWERARVDGWDCVVVSDPPLRLIRHDQRHTVEIRHAPIQGGYVDFAPHEAQMRVRRGPPRTSLLDDLTFYLTVHGSALAPLGPDTPALVVRKLAASHYRQLGGFCAFNVSYVHWRLSRQRDLELFDSAAVERQWSDVQALTRRIAEYCDDLDGAMVQARVSFADFDPSAVTTWRDVGADLRHLRLRFRQLKERADKIDAAITALVGIAGNRQALREQERSLHEAKSTKALTLLGLVFIPLAYTASLFSMSDPYGPGNSAFWIYFAVSLPLIMVVVAAYYVADRWYYSFGNSPSLRGDAKEIRPRPDSEKVHYPHKTRSKLSRYRPTWGG